MADPSSSRPQRPTTPHPPADQAFWGELSSIRKMRGTIRPPIDVSRLILSQLPEVRKLRRQFATIAESWMAIVPEALAAQTRLESVSRGILNVKVPNAAIRFELDRFLRSGGEAKLLSAFPVAIRRVRIGLEIGPDGG